MKDKLRKMTIAGAILLGCGGSVQANPISGSIDFTGGVTFNHGGATATAITGYNHLSVLAGAETGTYSGLNAGGGNGVNGISGLAFSNFGFGGNVLNPNPTSLWTVTFGGTTYSFEATTVVIDFQNANQVDLQGTGIAYLNGGDATSGTWTIDATTAASKFTFGSSEAAGLPDGGTTVGLLGIAFGGCGLLARKLQKLA